MHKPLLCARFGPTLVRWPNARGSRRGIVIAALAAFTAGVLAADDSAAMQAAQIAFQNAAQSGKFLHLCPQFEGMSCGACVNATSAGDGVYCPTTKVTKGGDGESCSIGIFDELKGMLSVDVRAKLEASSLHSAQMYAKITPQESAVHYHSTVSATNLTCGDYVARKDFISFRFALFNSSSVKLNISTPSFQNFEAEVRDSEGRAFAFDSTMCGRVKHEGACGPARANLTPVTEPPAGGGRTVSRPTPTEPTTRSQTAFSGQPRLFVAGQVAAQDEMVVTVRGTNSFQGMVISAESNGRQTEAQVDSNGHAVIPVAAIAVGTTAASIVAVRVLDSGRQEVTRAQTQINPAITTAAAPPQVPALPALIPNGDVVTVPGRNLGTQSQLILGNRIQETLSASSSELTSFIDAPAVGPQTAYVRTPYGVSPLQTVTAYNFTVRASQTTITRGQHIQVTGHWEGLPAGSRIVFTNNSPSVIDMRVQGGNQNVFTVSKPTGDCQVNLTGKGNGGFVVDYQVQPPK